jgi:phosphatidylserine decarboxylase
LLKNILHPIHPDGRKFIGIFAGVTLILFFVWQPLGWLGVVATLWCVYFFRDPPRVVPFGETLVVSPADGLVVSIDERAPPVELDMGSEKMVRVGIFLNVFDVHINRTPIGGTVVARHYHRGQFLNASLDKASDLNERMALRLRTKAGQDVAVVQIAGLVARRIVNWAVAGRGLETGERFGLIRFGSRTDLYLPKSWGVLVIEGQRVIGGETVIADAALSAPPRQGRIQ